MTPLPTLLTSLAALATAASASATGGIHHLPLEARVKRSDLSGPDLLSAKIASHEALKRKYGIVTDEDRKRTRREKRASSGSVALAGNDLVSRLERGDRSCGSANSVETGDCAGLVDRHNC